MSAKKSFKAALDPALQFISKKTVQEQSEKKEEAPDGCKLNPLYIEKRSKRLQLLVQPSLYDKIKTKAETEGSSVNDFIHRILENIAKN